MKERFQEKPEVGSAVGRVLAMLANHKRGEVVTWAVIEEFAGFARYTQHWPAFWHRLRRDFLRDTGVCLRAVPAVGVRLLTTQEALTEQPAYRRRKAFRQMLRDTRELNAIPNRELTLSQRLLKARQLEATAQARRQVLRQLRAGHVLSKPSGDRRFRPVA